MRTTTRTTTTPSVRPTERRRPASRRFRASTTHKRRSFYEFEPAEADVVDLSPELSLASLEVDESDVIGRGSFSACFSGTYTREDGEKVDVVVKKYASVRGRDVESFYADELEACRALKKCPGVASFMGECGVGMYLVWENVGATSLEMCLERGDAAFDYARLALRSCEMTSDKDLYSYISKSLAQSISSVHENEFIHRDVKPANVLLNEKASTAVLCDLGACADMQTGRNMDGSEAIFDPVYGAPEQFRVVSGGFPSISGLFGKKKEDSRELEASGAIPTTLFDAYSLGVTLLRLGVPSLRSASAMAQARRDIDACGGDVEVWRREVCVPGVNDWSMVDATGAWTTICRLTADADHRWSIQEALESDAFLGQQ